MYIVQNFFFYKDQIANRKSSFSHLVAGVNSDNISEVGTCRKSPLNYVKNTKGSASKACTLKSDWSMYVFVCRFCPVFVCLLFFGVCIYNYVWFVCVFMQDVYIHDINNKIYILMQQCMYVFRKKLCVYVYLYENVNNKVIKKKKKYDWWMWPRLYR